jgi:hypothetical protein
MCYILSLSGTRSRHRFCSCGCAMKILHTSPGSRDVAVQRTTYLSDLIAFDLRFHAQAVKLFSQGLRVLIISIFFRKELPPVLILRQTNLVSEYFDLEAQSLVISLKSNSWVAPCSFLALEGRRLISEEWLSIKESRTLLLQK